MFRTAALTAVAAAMLALTIAPAYAGPAETAFLQKLSNTWSGKGRLSGAESGPIACKMVITAGSRNAKFQGRCAIPDMAQQAFSGSISYNDKLQRYEARTVSGVVPGVRQGNRLVFTTRERNIRGTAYSTMTMSATSLTVDFAVVDRSGEKTTSRISFTR